MRSLSPLHLYRCRACGHRGWRLGALRRMRRHRQPADAPGRPVERRDVDARRARLVRAVMAVVAAVGLGVAAGFVIQTCQSPAPAAAPGP